MNNSNFRQKASGVFAGGFLLLLLAYAVFFTPHESKSLSDDKGRYSTAAYGWQSTGDPPLHFQVKCSGNRTLVTFHGQKVTLSDKFKMSKGTQDSASFDKTKFGIVNININGKDFTNPSQVEIRTEVDDANRYWMQVMVAELSDKKTNTTRLAILQSFPRVTSSNYVLNKLNCRILFVDDKGKVEKEWFKFGDRFSPSYRAMLAYYVAPEPI